MTIINTVDMIIIQDSREQLGFDFEDSIIACLKSGDYGLREYPDVAIERKSVNDAIGSVTSGRTRFKKEWERGSKLNYFAIVIEGREEDIRRDIKTRHTDFEKIHWLTKSVMNTYYHWSVKYGVPVFFCKNRESAKLLTLTLLRAFDKYKKKGLI